jgi:hypothetical protein
MLQMHDEKLPVLFNLKIRTQAFLSTSFESYTEK